MRNRFDHVAKKIGRAALGRAGATFVHDEISPETQYADLRHEPDPRRDAERRRLGLLGRLAAVLCLIEIYGHAPSADEIRACLTKHLAFWQQRTRRTRAANKKRRGKRQRPGPSIEPFLWIIAAGAPSAILARLGLGPAPGWPAGVYLFGDELLRMGIVVASELPRERATLLVRLMAAGPLLGPAIEDLRKLEAGARERAITERILLDLQHVLRQKPSRTPEEEEIAVRMLKTWEEERAESSAETRARDVLTVLEVRRIVVSATARRRILAEKDLRQLARWLKKAIVAASVQAVIGGPAPRPAGRLRVAGAR